jgi:hypothetical protein
MTHLQQTCADMLASQDQLQRLHTFDRQLRREPPAKNSALRLQVQYATAVHTTFLANTCALRLQRHQAANDATILPGAA